MKKVGLIGFGTIGSYIYEHLKGEVEFVFVYSRHLPADEAVKGSHISTPEELEEKCKAGLDLVVECAVAQNVIDLAPIVLKYADFMAFSTTALAEEGFQEKVEALCSQYDHTFYVPTVPC